MYMRESRKQVPVAPVPFGLATALAVSVFATLYLGILPNRILQVAQHSAQDLLPPPSAAAAAQIPQPAPTSAH
jgi:NADH:ubiquinone oxidoreductase subunit 2 (subunit N)